MLFRLAVGVEGEVYFKLDIVAINNNYQATWRPFALLFIRDYADLPDLPNFNPSWTRKELYRVNPTPQPNLMTER